MKKIVFIIISLMSLQTINLIEAVNSTTANQEALFKKIQSIVNSQGKINLSNQIAMNRFSTSFKSGINRLENSDPRFSAILNIVLKDPYYLELQKKAKTSYKDQTILDGLQFDILDIAAGKKVIK